MSTKLLTVAQLDEVQRGSTLLRLTPRHPRTDAAPLTPASAGA